MAARSINIIDSTCETCQQSWEEGKECQGPRWERKTSEIDIPCVSFVCDFSGETSQDIETCCVDTCVELTCPEVPDTCPDGSVAPVCENGCCPDASCCNTDCEGYWLPCSYECETSEQRIWTETLAQNGNGAECPTEAPDCVAGMDSCETALSYCASWGDPHITPFTGRRFNDHRLDEDYVLAQLGDLTVWVTHAPYWKKSGGELLEVATNKKVYVTDASRDHAVVLSYDVEVDAVGDVQIDDDVVRKLNFDDEIISGDYWPSRKRPGYFDSRFQIDGSDLRVFLRYREWRGRQMIDVGVSVPTSGLEVATGICTEGPNPDEDGDEGGEPEEDLPTCSLLTTCCAQFSVSEDLEAGCLVDAAWGCCDDPDATANCCDEVEEEDCNEAGAYECSSFDTCDASGICIPTPDVDCLGTWECNEECTRVFQESQAQSGEGADCPENPGTECSAGEDQCPEEPTCDNTLMCGEALTCVDGKTYPTTCGPDNCDEPVKDDCEPEEPCDDTLMCGEALTCVDGKTYPTTCGPDNCDEPVKDVCDPEEPCDETLMCGEALTCVDGKTYPTTCGPDNCDEPVKDYCEPEVCEDVGTCDVIKELQRQLAETQQQMVEMQRQIDELRR